MFDKMKQLMDMQKKMQEMKRNLDAAQFSVASGDNSVTITMNGSQQVLAVTLNRELKDTEKTNLEKSLVDAYNRAIKRSHELAAQQMKDVTGLNLPGLL